MKSAKGLFVGLGLIMFLATPSIRAEDDMMMGVMGGAPPKATGAMAPAAASPAPTMGGMMGMMDGMMGEMGMAPKPATSGMKDDAMMDKDMGAMTPKSGMAAMPAALPAMPRSPHLYHVGSTGFFLDHAKKIDLTTDQKTSIALVKKQAMERRAAFEKKIVQSEQQLWALTDSDAPDAGQIQAKLGEIEKLRAEKRYDFIKSVGDAAKVLTDRQRQMVVKTMAPMKSM